MRLIDTQPFQLLDSKEHDRMALSTPPPGPRPNAQRFPLSLTRSHFYVRRVCPRPANTSETIAINNLITVLGRRFKTFSWVPSDYRDIGVSTSLKERKKRKNPTRLRRP